jgi:hypothetical protein
MMKPAAVHLRIGRLTVNGGAGPATGLDPAAVADAVRAQLAQRWGAGAPAAAAPAAPAWAPAVADAVAQRWSPGQGGRHG